MFAILLSMVTWPPTPPIIDALNNDALAAVAIANLHHGHHLAARHMLVRHEISNVLVCLSLAHFGNDDDLWSSLVFDVAGVMSGIF